MRVSVVGDGPLYYVRPFGQVSGGVFYSGIPYPVLFFPQNPPENFTLEGKISEGEQNSVGERPCLHYQLKGDAVAFPGNEVVSGMAVMQYSYVGDKMPWPTVTFTSQGKRETFFGTASLGLYVGTQTFPDCILKSGASYRDVKVSYTYSHSKYTRVVSWTYYPQKPYQPSTFTNTQSVYMDIPGKRYSEDLIRWYPFGIVDWSKKPDPTFRGLGLPRSWEDFDQLYQKSQRKFILPRTDDIFGDLARRCANDARVVQTNGLELASELRVITQSIKEALELAASPNNAVKIASVWLSYKYGLRLTGIAVKSIFEDIEDRLARKFLDGNTARTRAKEHMVFPSVISSVGNLEITYCYKMFHSRRSGDWRDALRVWFDSGLFPSLVNVWDLIPLSFVFDWFYKMENFLEGIDANTYWSLYDIRGVTYSEKQVYRNVASQFSGFGFQLSGDVDFVRYDRQVGSHIHKPLFFEPSPREFKNYAELASLFVVGLRK